MSRGISSKVNRGQRGVLPLADYDGGCLFRKRRARERSWVQDHLGTAKPARNNLRLFGMKLFEGFR